MSIYGGLSLEILIVRRKLAVLLLLGVLFLDIHELRDGIDYGLPVLILIL